MFSDNEFSITLNKVDNGWTVNHYVSKGKKSTNKTYVFPDVKDALAFLVKLVK
jgi:hypothetical protein